MWKSLPPLFCETCGQSMVNRPDRKTRQCKKCMSKNRCPKCGQINYQSATHKCASVDLKGVRHCRTCGVVLRNSGSERWRTVCGYCGKSAWRKREREKRVEMKAMLGGKCQRCGYEKCQAALHFHHVDGRTDAEFQTTKGSANLREIISHPERFQLLCANCHIEHHLGGE